MKSIVGQYECVHRSGVGLDYFTSRIDRLTMQANGQFTFVVQERSRVSHAAKSLFSGQQLDVNAPESQRKGRYTTLGDTVTFNFDDGTQEQGQLTPQGVQIGANSFEKVSDSTLIPPTQRMQSNMEDIAKGLKIAATIGGAAIKAAKTVQDTLQTAQGPKSSPVQNSSSQSSNQQSQSNQSIPNRQSQTQYEPTSQPQYQTTQSTATNQDAETLFCDQCGAPVRPGKHFCNQCGARLP